MDTNLRNQKIGTLNELIEVTRDSASFYSDAAGKVENPQLRSLFQQMAESKNGLVGAISRDVRSEGATPEEGGTFRGTMQQMYGDMRAKFGDNNYEFVSQLEESEDRMLDAFRDVMADTQAPAPVKDAVGNYLPTVQQHHDAMRERKWAMQTRH